MNKHQINEKHIRERFIRLYDDCLNKQIPESLVVLASLAFNLKQNQYVCFVEGYDDKEFYENVENNTILKNAQFFYTKKITLRKLLKHYINKNENYGKTGVFGAYNNLNKKSKFYMKKCIFIVDHDYNGTNCHNAPSNAKSVISTTKGYSFENYFVIDNNLEKVVKLIETKHKRKNTQCFKNYHEFIDNVSREIYEYVRLKSTVEANKSNLSDSEKGELNKVDSIGSILSWPTLDFKKLRSSVSTLKNIVYLNEDLKQYYDGVTSKYSNSMQWVQGHAILNYLNKYLHKEYGIRLAQNQNHQDHELYIKAVKSLDVDIVLKTGQGKNLTNNY